MNSPPITTQPKDEPRLLPKSEEPDPVDEADEESFPASDPPAFNPGHAGAK